MKIFLSYRYTGEDLLLLEKVLGEIKWMLEGRGHSVFISMYQNDFFEREKFSIDQVYDYCNQTLAEYDTVLFFIKSAEASKGMELELAEAKKHKKRIVVAIQEKLDFKDFRNSADKVLEYRDLDHFYTLLNKHF